MLKTIGEELKFVRLRKNLTTKEVAEDIGINRETLRRYENNCSGLSIERLEEILSYYNIPRTIFFENVCANMHQINSKI